MSGGAGAPADRLEFGGLDQLKEQCRDVRGTRSVEELARDVRYGVHEYVRASRARCTRGTGRGAPSSGV